MEHYNHRDALTIPKVLDEITKYLKGSNVHRLAGTSRAFARAAVRFDDTMVRTIRALQDDIASLRIQRQMIDREIDRLVDIKHNATYKFLAVLMQFDPIEERTGGTAPQLFYGHTIATAYIVRHLVLHPNDAIRGTIERISTLLEAFWSGEPPPDFPNQIRVDHQGARGDPGPRAGAVQKCEA